MLYLALRIMRLVPDESLFTSLWMMVTRLGISSFAYLFFSCEVSKRKHRLNSYYDRGEWIISGCKMHFAAWTSFGHVWVVSYLYKVPVRYAQSVKSVTYHDRHGHDPVLDPFLLSGRLGHQRRHQLLQRGFKVFVFVLFYWFYINNLDKSIKHLPLKSFKNKVMSNILQSYCSWVFFFFLFPFFPLSIY